MDSHTHTETRRHGQPPTHRETPRHGQPPTHRNRGMDSHLHNEIPRHGQNPHTETLLHGQPQTEPWHGQQHKVTAAWTSTHTKSRHEQLHTKTAAWTVTHRNCGIDSHTYKNRHTQRGLKGMVMARQSTRDTNKSYIREYRETGRRRVQICPETCIHRGI